MPNSAPPTAILFDWGDTLVRFPGMTTDGAGHMACLGRLYRELQDDPDRPEVLRGLTWRRFSDAYRATATEHIERSRRTGREIGFEQRFEDTLRRAGCVGVPPRALLERLADGLARELIAAARPMDHAEEVVTALAERFVLAAVSNYPAPAVVTDTLAHFGLARHFTAVVISGDLGWVKPHRRLFEAALDRLGLTPEGALFVGDDLCNDMKGAKAVGFRTA